MQSRWLVKQLKRFIADETGATAIEYGLIVALIAVVIIASVTTLGSKLNKGFGSVNSKLP
jgi:pilus assembly protein Flp/PilA